MNQKWFKNSHENRFDHKTVIFRLILLDMFKLLKNFFIVIQFLDSKIKIQNLIRFIYLLNVSHANINFIIIKANQLVIQYRARSLQLILHNLNFAQS